MWSRILKNNDVAHKHHKGTQRNTKQSLKSVVKHVGENFEE
jgi:hypothetical protein